MFIVAHLVNLRKWYNHYQHLSGMPKKNTNLTADQNESQNSTTSNPLGIDVTSLSSLKSKDLINNKPLASTMLTYTRSCESKIARLETENETLKTYANNYETNKIKSRIAALLAFLSTVFIGFGTNFLTSSGGTNSPQLIAGGVFVVTGVILFVTNLFLLFN